MPRKLLPKPIFRAPAAKKANQPHIPKRGKGSFRRKARTEKRDVSGESGPV